MNAVIHYGTVTRIIPLDDNIIQYEESKIVSGEATKQTTVFQQSLFVKNEQEALAEFLKLLDDARTGAIKDPGIQCFTDATGTIARIEKTWSIQKI